MAHKTTKEDERQRAAYASVAVSSGEREHFGTNPPGMLVLRLFIAGEFAIALARDESNKHPFIIDADYYQLTRAGYDPKIYGTCRIELVGTRTMEVTDIQDTVIWEGPVQNG